MKKIVTCLLALCMAFVLLPFSASAETTEVAGGAVTDTISWVLDSEGTLTLSGTGSYTFASPAERPWYSYSNSIRKVVVESGITKVGDYSFCDCPNLTSVELAEGIKYIGWLAFTNCTGLTEITLPASVEDDPDYYEETLGVSAFQNCTSLKKIYFRGNAPSFGYNCFVNVTATAYYPMNNDSWTADKLQNHQGTLTWVAYDPTAIASGFCGKNVTWALKKDGTMIISGTGAMYDFDPENGYQAPWYENYRDQITSLVIEEGVTTIGDDSFRFCRNITGVTIPETVTRIGDQAFVYCESLTGIDIPASVAEIGYMALTYNRSLTAISVDKDNAYFTSDASGVLYNKNMTTLICAPCGYVGDYEIPQGVTEIEDYAFSYCPDLTSVTVPASVTEIGLAAFLGDSLEGIWVDAANKAYCSDKIGALYNETMTALIQVPAKCAGSYTIPGTVAKIGVGAFTNCAGLTSVVIPASVTSIEDLAFAFCDSLTSVAFRGNAPAFGYGVFAMTKTKASYPANNATWTADVMQQYQGTVTWVAVGVPGSSVPAKPYKITNTVSGVHVYWKAVDGVAKYGLWRSETGKNGTYKWIGNPTVPHFTDTKVESGKTYYYKVTTMDTTTGKHSDKSEAIGITYVATPDITSRENVAAGVKLGWNKIEGATGYAIYRKSYSGTDAWVRVGTIEGNATFTWTDTSVKNNNGTAYKYTIRALAGSNMKTLSGCRNAGRTMVRLSSQTLKTAAKASATSIKCSWTTSKAVTGYEIRFMVGDTVYKTFTVGNYKTGVKTFTGLKAGQTYTIMVRTYVKVDGVGSFYSDWSTAKTVKL